jgi:hypothetical protein
MTDETSSYEQPDEDKERRRQVIEDVLVAFRPDVQEEFGDLIGRDVPSPDGALQNLARTADIGRLLKHRLLIDALRRTLPGIRVSLDDAALDVLHSTVGGHQDRRAARVDEAKDVLDRVVAAEGASRLRPRDWARWVRGTNEIFKFSTQEATFLACDDERMVRKRRAPDGQIVESRLIVAQFWSDRPPAAFARYIDPSNWPACSAFWQEMRELPPKTGQEPEYDCDFRETVGILGRTLTVPLQVGFRVRPFQGRVWTRFNIARARFTQAVPVDVDTGTVSAESMTAGPAQTLVRATKYLHWRDNPPDFSKLACDFGWSEFMVQMAESCLEPAGTPGPQAAAPGVGTPVDDAIRRLVDEVVTQCRDGIGASAPDLEKLIGRFTGRSWDPRWINDLLAMGLLTVDRYGSIASGVRRFADSLKDAADRRDDDE